MNTQELCKDCSNQFYICDHHKGPKVIPDVNEIVDAKLVIDGVEFVLSPVAAVEALRKSRNDRLETMSKMTTKIMNGMCASLVACECYVCKPSTFAQVRGSRFGAPSKPSGFGGSTSCGGFSIAKSAFGGSKPRRRILASKTASGFGVGFGPQVSTRGDGVNFRFADAPPASFLGKRPREEEDDLLPRKRHCSDGTMKIEEDPIGCTNRISDGETFCGCHEHLSDNDTYRLMVGFNNSIH